MCPPVRTTCALGPAHAQGVARDAAQSTNDSHPRVDAGAGLSAAGAGVPEVRVRAVCAAAPPEYQVALASSAEAENFKTLFQRGDERLEKTGQLQEAQKPGIRKTAGFQAQPSAPWSEPKPPRLRLVSPDDDEPNTSLDDIIAEQRADIGVRIRQRRSGRWDVQFIVQRGSIVGHNAEGIH